MKQAHLLFLADHPDNLSPLSAMAAQAGWACTWQVATTPTEMARALEGTTPFDGVFLVLGRSWDDEVIRQRVDSVDPPPLPPVVVMADDSRRAPDWLAAGAIDVVPWSEPWRLGPALGHLAALREQARLAKDKACRLAFIGIVEQLSLARSMASVMVIVRRAARWLTQADGAAFVLRDNGYCHYADEDAIAPLWKGQRFPMDQCISGWAMLNRKPVVIEDVFSDPRVPITAYEPTFVRSLVMVPIRTQDPIGAIGTYWARHRQPTADEVDLLQALADTTSVAIENVQLQAGLERRVRERTEELRLANEELEAFSSSVSHDLRNPLNAIDGFSALLEMDLSVQPEAQSRRQLAHVREAARRMSTIIDDLLVLARVGRGELRRERTDLGEMAREVMANLQRASPGRTVAFDVAPGLCADCDPGLVRIVLENLLSNAWKYSSKTAQARIELAALPVEGDGPQVFCVRDNGAGFDPAKAGKLFKPFQRLHPESEFAGVGVGLTTVRRAVRRHGGEVWATSAPGQGASFFFMLAPGDKAVSQRTEGLREAVVS